MKYHNIKTIVDGITFDSKKEALRYTELKLMERARVIKCLECQKPFILLPKSKYGREIKYICDFYYYDNERKKYVIEDVKSDITRKDKVYRLKKRMLAELYGKEIEEI